MIITIFATIIATTFVIIVVTIITIFVTTFGIIVVMIITIIAATTISFIHQGVYGLVTNLGSLVVRTLLFPFEEASFAAFSHKGSAAPPTKAALQRDAELLSALLQGIALVGMLCAGFGPPYASTAVQVLYPQWADTDAAQALALYRCV